MQEQQLYDKYSEGKHWENHPIIYAERFSDFLKQKNFQGLIIDFGCGTGRDVDFFSKKGFNVLELIILKKIWKKQKEIFLI